jgi:hypothetical protein
VEVGDCWEWLGCFNGKVPKVRYDGNMMSVRRVFALDRQPNLTKNQYVTCTCKNWRCVNPDHIGVTARTLFLRNVSKGPNTKKAAHVRYLAAARAKLTPEQEQEIRLSDETGAVVAKRYGISESLASKIRRGEGSKVSNIWAGLMR